MRAILPQRLGSGQLREAAAAESLKISTNCDIFIKEEEEEENESMSEPYVVQCWTCLGEFDAADSVWCSCDPRNPTRLCQFCLQCFCNASDDYKADFWKGATDVLKNELRLLSEAKGKLGESLIRSNLLTTDQLLKALEYQKMRGCKLGEALVELGFVAQKDIDYFLERQERVSTASLDNYTFDPALFQKLPPPFCYEKLILPLDEESLTDEAVLTVAMADPKDVGLIDLIQTKTDAKIIPYQAPPEKIRSLLEAHFSQQELKPKEEAVADVKKLAQNLLLGGVNSRASNLYLEPKEDSILVSYRIDGILFRHKPLAAGLWKDLAAEFRRMVGLATEGRGETESGRAIVKHGVKEYDVNVRCYPSPSGENLSVKFVDRERFFKDLDGLGLAPDDLRRMRKALAGTRRTMLITGPVMSGRTTTAYSVVKYLSARGRRVATIESHVLTPIKGVEQVHVTDRKFAKALQSLLKTDPQAIVLSDLPDNKTASLAFKAGTKVFVAAVLEASSTAEALDEILRLGVSPRDISSSLSLILNQRLVRRICPACRKPTRVLPARLQRAGFTPEEMEKIKTFAGEGCEKCHNTGYAGRVPVSEALEWNDELTQFLEQGASGAEIARVAVGKGMTLLRRRCLELVHEGATTVEEFEKAKL
jgi:type IV pilus assembly protein PilB